VAGRYLGGSGANRVLGQYPHPSGSFRNPSKVFPNASGNFWNLFKVFPDSSGSLRNLSGSFRRLSGSSRNPSGLRYTVPPCRRSRSATSL
jgi:hypothetical protein